MNGPDRKHVSSKPVKSTEPVVSGKVRKKRKEVTYIRVDNEVYQELDDDIAIMVPDGIPKVQNPVRKRERKWRIQWPCDQAAVANPSTDCHGCGCTSKAHHGKAVMKQEPNEEDFPPAKRSATETSGCETPDEPTVKQEQNVKQEPETGSSPSTVPTAAEPHTVMKTEKPSQSVKEEDADAKDEHCSTMDAKLYNLFDTFQTVDKEINILLLGSTGVGKSTFINAFANYVTYGRLEDAVDEDIFCLIPTSFTITDSQYNQVKVEVGQSSNEEQGDGQSRTQDCRCYEFNFASVKIRLIDTPGIGDTRGILYDKRNFDHTLTFIGQFQALHGICILMKPNEARLTATFQFCVKQLLSHLATSASRNIMFVFTNARGTFYRPGDTAPTLKRILKDVHENPPNVRIDFSERNTFCLDSEAFRFLVAVRQGIEFKVEEMASFESSWQRSVSECLRLIEHVLGLPPHPIQDTVSINEARKLIHQLSKPLADIVDNIETNLKVLESHRQDILGNTESIKVLMTKSVIPVVDIEIQTIGCPRTVCTSGKCRKIYCIGAIQKYHFPMSCHDPCTMRYVSGEIVDVPELRFCDAMNRNGYCKKCGCSYRMHMHIYYTTVEVAREVADTAIQNQIKSKEDAKRFAEFKVQELEQRSAVLKEERDKIMSAAAQFAHFLKHNAIAPYNDSFESYLMHLIENQKTMVQEGGLSQTNNLQGLEGMLKAYREEKAIFDMALSSDDRPSNVTLDKIFSLKDDLYNLKITGNYIRQLHQAQELPRRHELKTDHVVISQEARSKVKPKRYRLSELSSLKGLDKLLYLVRRKCLT